MLGYTISITGPSTTTEGAPSGDVTLHIAETGSIIAPDTGIQAYSPGSNKIIVDGIVHGQTAYGIVLSGADPSHHDIIKVGAGGLVRGGSHAMSLYDNSTVTNSGTIRSDNQNGIMAFKNLTVTNTGLIEGIQGIKSHGKLDLTNSGTIRSSAPEIYRIPSIIGSDEGDIVRNTGLIEDDVSLGKGNDLYDGRGGTAPSSLYLGDNDDVAYGGSGNDQLRGEAGNDVLDGGGGNDQIIGGEGIDIARYSGTAAAYVDLSLGTQDTRGYGTDHLSGIENLEGGAGSDKFAGNGVANKLIGNGGNDTLVGAGGADQLDGGLGSDTAEFSGAMGEYTISKNADGTFTIADKNAGRDGTDHLKDIEFVKFSDKTVDLHALPTDPDPTTPTPGTPTPGTPTPIVPGPSTSVQVLAGTTGKNVLTGSASNDKLYGGHGNDVLTGGTGMDVFVFDTPLGKGTSSKNQNKKVNFDTITDFNPGEDKIWLDNKVFKKLGKGSEAAPGALNKNFFKLGKAKDKDDFLVYKNGVVYYDADGSGTKFKGVEFIKIANKAALSAADFLIV
jgi:Ca2+-binding RTX toxin-like protein